MPFEKGRQKTGGRQKGSQNKIKSELLERCQKEGVDPFNELLRIMKSGEKEELRLAAAREACKYVYPQLKAVDMNVEASGNGFRIVVEDYVKPDKET